MRPNATSRTSFNRKTGQEVDPAIIVEDLSKQYRLGELGGAGQFRDRILAALRREPAVLADDENIVWALRDVNFVVYHKWDNTRLFVQAIDADRSLLITSGQGLSGPSHGIQ